MSNTISRSYHYAYPFVTWSSTLVGVIVALITAAMPNLLGAALGIAALAVGQSAVKTSAAGFVGIAWIVISNLIALAFGAWVAGRSTANPDHHGGALQGIAVWAATSLAVLFLAGSVISGATGTVLQGASIAANAPNGAISEQSDRPQSQAPAGNALDDARANLDRNSDAIKDGAAKAAGMTAIAALGTFLAMALGLVAAIFGARAGARHPSWADRPLYANSERRV